MLQSHAVPLRRKSLAILATLSLLAALFVAAIPTSTARADSGLGVTNWWQHLSGEKTLSIRSENLSLDYVTSQLPTYQANGYSIINVTWPVKGGPIEIFNGFAASDFMEVDPRVGTSQDWTELLTAAHARGMAVITWFNPSYFWTGSPLFKQAEADVKIYGPVRSNQPANSPARFFQWQYGAGAAAKPCDTCGENYPSDRWVTDADASPTGTTVSYKSSWSDQPSADFASTEWRAALATYLQHWLNTGIDGFVFDAPVTWVNCDSACVKSSVIDIVKAYPNRMAAAETPRESGAIVTGFDATTDFSFWYNGTATTAIANQNPSGIEASLAVRDGIVSAGGVDYNAPAFATSTVASANLLEAATIASSGNYLVVWDPGTGFGKPDAWAAEGAEFAKITSAVNNNPVLQAMGSREKVPTNNDNSYYSFVRTTPNGSEKAVVILNYTTSQATITATVGGQGVANGSTLDLLNGGAGPAVSGGQVTVTLPARGYAFIKVPVSPCTTNLCSVSAGTPALTTLSTEGTSDWVHWGRSLSTSVDRKASANLIGAMTRIGSSSTNQYGNSNRAYSWTGGTPTSSATASATGLYTNGVGNGFSFTAPAGTTTQTLSVYLGAWQAKGTLTATLSDGSAAAITDASARDSANVADRVVKITYRANSASQTLTVNYVLTQEFGVGGNISLQSATLAGPSSTVVDNAASGWTYESGWSGYSDPLANAGTAHGGNTIGGFGSLTFTGSRVELYVWKESGAGTLEVFVDGVSQGTRSQDNGGAESYNQFLISATWPTSGSHTIKIVATNTNWTMVDYARVFG